MYQFYCGSFRVLFSINFLIEWDVLFSFFMVVLNWKGEMSMHFLFYLITTAFIIIFINYMVVFTYSPQNQELWHSSADGSQHPLQNILNAERHERYKYLD